MRVQVKKSFKQNVRQVLTYYMQHTPCGVSMQVQFYFYKINNSYTEKMYLITGIYVTTKKRSLIF